MAVNREKNLITEQNMWNLHGHLPSGGDFLIVRNWRLMI